MAASSTAVLVTGASRGFGRAAAIALTAELAAKQKSVDLFLWARDVAKLQDTERAAQQVAARHGAAVRTFSTSVDLGAQAGYVPHVESFVQQLQQPREPPYDAVYVVHNAATVGQLGCTEVWQSASELAAYWELNLNHVCFFNARLLAALRGQRPAATRLVLVNISSGVATRAIAGSGLYCTGKAAREMHFRVVAEENKSGGRQQQVRVVNYSPGAMDTEMQDEIRESTATPEETRAMFVAYKEQGMLVRAEDSALYCAQVLVEDAYESGSTVRYDRSKLVPREGLFP